MVAALCLYTASHIQKTTYNSRANKNPIRARCEIVKPNLGITVARTRDATTLWLLRRPRAMEILFPIPLYDTHPPMRVRPRRGETRR